MAVYTLLGRELAAELFMGETFVLAVGEGDPVWDGAPIEPLPNQLSLVAAIGVTRLRDKQYVTPDEAGTITMGDGSKWSVSAQRTRYVYLEFKLDLADAQPATLRENGVYHGTEIDAAVPGGQLYIPLEDVTALGDLIHIDRYNSIVRDGSLEQAFSFILTF